jgi:hypothetical protein
MPMPANTLSEVDLGALCAGRVTSAAAPAAASAEVLPRADILNPLLFPGWNQLVATHPGASFFHGSAWANVLHDTYGHRPNYFCRLETAGLQALLPVMEVRSTLTRRRGIALPFTDFAPALSTSPGQQQELFAAALKYGRERRWSCLECRGGPVPTPQATPSLSFYGHVLYLSIGEPALFNNLDSAVRRGIRKAQAAGLVVQFSTGEEAMQSYYSLHCGTRRRHGLPPQPYRFFSNIARHILARGQGFIASISIESKTVASAIFFHNQRRAIYKFGASDFAFQELRPNNLLMWEATKHCASLGVDSLHFGRTSFGNEGLRRFKLGFGAREEQIDYYKFDFSKNAFVADSDRVRGWYNTVFRHLSGPLHRLAGRILYPHLA